MSRQVSSLKTASRKGNIIRNILFQNTNGTKNVATALIRQAEEMAEKADAFVADLLGQKQYALAA